MRSLTYCPHEGASRTIGMAVAPNVAPQAHAAGANAAGDRIQNACATQSPGTFTFLAGKGLSVRAPTRLHNSSPRDKSIDRSSHARDGPRSSAATLC